MSEKFLKQVLVDTAQTTEDPKFSGCLVAPTKSRKREEAGYSGLFLTPTTCTLTTTTVTCTRLFGVDSTDTSEKIKNAKSMVDMQLIK